MNYLYKCFNCSKEISSNVIEKEFHYLCPACGRAERNKPLEGVLTVEYDYFELKRKLSREDFFKLPPGKFWLYPDLWPVNFQNFNSEQLIKLSLPSDQLLKYKIDGRDLWLFDETRNPTLSYKDRASSLVALKALQLGITEIAAASTGNAGSSIAGICARLGLRSHIFVPSAIPEAKRIQIQSFGSNLYVVAGSYDDAFDLCLEAATFNNWYNRNTAYNPFTIEGKKRIENAVYGLEKLEAIVDTLIVIPNDKLLELAPELPLHTAFKVADEILTNAVKGTTELVTKSGLVNLDFADIKAVMTNGGVSLIGMGESDSQNRAQEAVEKAINNPLLDVDVSNATGALVNIIGGQDLSLDEAKTIVQTVGEKLSEDARLIWGAQMSEDMGKSIRVMLIITGVHSSQILGPGESVTDKEQREIEEELGIEFYE